MTGRADAEPVVTTTVVGLTLTGQQLECCRERNGCGPIARLFRNGPALGWAVSLRVGEWPGSHRDQILGQDDDLVSCREVALRKRAGCVDDSSAEISDADDVDVGEPLIYRGSVANAL